MLFSPVIAASEHVGYEPDKAQAHTPHAQD